MGVFMTSLRRAKEICPSCCTFLWADTDFKGGLFHQHPGIIFKFSDVLEAERITNSTDTQIKSQDSFNQP